MVVTIEVKAQLGYLFETVANRIRFTVPSDRIDNGEGLIQIRSDHKQVLQSTQFTIKDDVS